MVYKKIINGVPSLSSLILSGVFVTFAGKCPGKKTTPAPDQAQLDAEKQRLDAERERLAALNNGRQSRDNPAKVDTDLRKVMNGEQIKLLAAALLDCAKGMPSFKRLTDAQKYEDLSEEKINKLKAGDQTTARDFFADVINHLYKDPYNIFRLDSDNSAINSAIEGAAEEFAKTKKKSKARLLQALVNHYNILIDTANDIAHNCEVGKVFTDMQAEYTDKLAKIEVELGKRGIDSLFNRSREFHKNTAAKDSFANSAEFASFLRGYKIDQKQTGQNDNTSWDPRTLLDAKLNTPIATCSVPKKKSWRAANTADADYAANTNEGIEDYRLVNITDDGKVIKKIEGKGFMGRGITHKSDFSFIEIPSFASLVTLGEDNYIRPAVLDETKANLSGVSRLFDNATFVDDDARNKWHKLMTGRQDSGHIGDGSNEDRTYKEAALKKRESLCHITTTNITFKELLFALFSGTGDADCFKFTLKDNHVLDEFKLNSDSFNKLVAAATGDNKQAFADLLGKHIETEAGLQQIFFIADEAIIAPLRSLLQKHAAIPPTRAYEALEINEIYGALAKLINGDNKYGHYIAAELINWLSENAMAANNININNVTFAMNAPAVAVAAGANPNQPATLEQAATLATGATAVLQKIDEFAKKAIVAKGSSGYITTPVTQMLADNIKSLAGRIQSFYQLESITVGDAQKEFNKSLISFKSRDATEPFDIQEIKTDLTQMVKHLKEILAIQDKVKQEIEDSNHQLKSSSDLFNFVKIQDPEYKKKLVDKLNTYKKSYKHEAKPA